MGVHTIGLDTFCWQEKAFFEVSDYEIVGYY